MVQVAMVELLNHHATDDEYRLWFGPYTFTIRCFLVVFVQGGVVIVDSPGIGDSEQVNKIALDYLPQAYAFIYLLNSSNAGGLQEDRVSKT